MIIYSFVVCKGFKYFQYICDKYNGLYYLNKIFMNDGLSFRSNYNPNVYIDGLFTFKRRRKIKTSEFSSQFGHKR
jgi:hypothetical protein